jgi:serine/threonine protein kinase
MTFCENAVLVDGLTDRYEVLSELGRGNYGIVVKVRSLTTNTILAAKRIPKGPSDKYTLREIETLRACTGIRGVVRLHEVLESPTEISLIIDFVEGGDLMTFVVNKGGITEMEACKIVHQVLRTLEAIHGRDVVHRDIKPHNILVREVDGEGIRIKLCDFGLAKKLPKDQRCMMTPAGDLDYSAPQIHDAIQRGMIGVACYRDEAMSYDVFSVGVTAYILLAGKMPYAPQESHASPPRFPRVFSNDAVDLLEPMFANNPRARPGVAECLLKQWFAMLDSMEEDRSFSNDSLPLPERAITEIDFDEGVGPAPEEPESFLADACPTQSPLGLAMKPFPGGKYSPRSRQVNPLPTSNAVDETGV